VSASVLVAYATLYGSTLEGAEAVTTALRECGLEVDIQLMRVKFGRITSPITHTMRRCQGMDESNAGTTDSVWKPLYRVSRAAALITAVLIPIHVIVFGLRKYSATQLVPN
jgi:flavorubredoxin